MADDDKDYEVGYGKPPKTTRFQKGKSGNPKGRPKGAKGVRANLRRELETKVKVREGNREVMVSKAEAISKRVVTNALRGDDKAMMAILKLDPELYGGTDLEEDVAGQALSPETVDYDILRDFFRNGMDDDRVPGEAEVDHDDS